jgi:hypothetical protein
LAQGFNLITSGDSANWLNSSLPASNPASTEFYNNTHFGARTDYVNTTLPFAGNGPGTGCGMLFLYYLFHQLGFAVPDIIANAPGLDSSGNPKGGSCLRGVYRNLTGDDSDPFPYFASLLAAAFPPDQVAAIPGSNGDDPWPLGGLSFLGSKNTWGHDEVLDIIAHGGTYPDAINLALDGFSLNIVGGTVPSLPTIAFGGVTASPAGLLSQSTNPKIPQQILFTYDLKFAQPLGTFPPSGETPAAVASAINVLGNNFQAETEFFFLAGADPYFTNVVKDPSNPTAANVPWLSEDLRVFTATPGATPAAQYQFPVPGGPQFVESIPAGGGFDINGAYTYIQALLKYLNQKLRRSFRRRSLRSRQQRHSATNGGVHSRLVGRALLDDRRYELQQLQLRDRARAPKGLAGFRGRSEWRQGVLPPMGDADGRHCLEPVVDLFQPERR